MKITREPAAKFTERVDLVFEDDERPRLGHRPTTEVLVRSIRLRFEWDAEAGRWAKPTAVILGTVVHTGSVVKSTRQVDEYYVGAAAGTELYWWASSVASEHEPKWEPPHEVNDLFAEIEVQS